LPFRLPRRAVPVTWSAVGLALSSIAVLEAVRLYRQFGLRTPTGRLFLTIYRGDAIVLAFGLFCIFGGFVALRDLPIGRVLLRVCAAVWLAYSVLYLLAHGVEETSIAYAVAVAVVVVFALTTLFVLRRPFPSPPKPDLRPNP
jgi:hypothetical protein